MAGLCVQTDPVPRQVGVMQGFWGFGGWRLRLKPVGSSRGGSRRGWSVRPCDCYDLLLVRRDRSGFNTCEVLLVAMRCGVLSLQGEHSCGRGNQWQ